MTGPTIKSLLQKINLIEIDMDIQKQILAAIPSDRKADMEAAVKKIADQKNGIEALRQEIRALDEAEYQNLIRIEKAAQAFRDIARGKDFIQVNTLNESGYCFVTLSDGTRMDCLVTAKEANGNWTVLTLDGETREIPSGLIQQGA